MNQNGGQPKKVLASSSRHQDCGTRMSNCNFVDHSVIVQSKEDCGSWKLNPYGPAANPNIGINLAADERSDQLDFPDDCLKFISEILMEEDLDDQTASLCDYSALLATEKSLYDALAVATPNSSDQYPPFLGQRIGCSDYTCHQSYDIEISGHAVDENMGTAGGSGNHHGNDTTVETKMEGNWQRGRKNLARRAAIDYDEEGHRKSKQLASNIDEYVEMEQYDDVLLSKEIGGSNCRGESLYSGEGGKSKGCKQKKTRGKKKGDDEGDGIDLMTLLNQCAEAVSIFDLRNANELLKRIRLYSSPYGDNTQRVAHYLGNALGARLAGSGWQQCRENTTQHIPFSSVLKAYREQVTAIPVRRASYFLANNAISKLAEKAPRIHIIDFGIFFGFQWPGLIQELSKRPIGPPMLRITGIDYPANGFRPARRVEEAGRRLAEYCKRFNVPFQYQAIAKGWESITLEELNIDRDELLVINCVYMSRKLVDETVVDKNPRDSFLRLTRKLNPNLFIHGIVNGSYSTPIFVRRFKEALFHYSCLFDMFEATLPRESEERVLVENHVHGTDALNVIACEGTERIERPETYRQWQVRIQRAGFTKLPLDDQVVNRVKDHVKNNHHKDFLVEDDGYWMFQGWKGRILYAISCWQLT